jgi:CrcB protein
METQWQEGLNAEPLVDCQHIDPHLTRPCTSLSSAFPGATIFARRAQAIAEAEGVAYLLIGIGGFLGANARYLLGGWIAERYGTAFPYGTLVINVSGSFILGFFLVFISERVLAHPHWRGFFAIGFLGAYTTFSTFSFESLALIQERSYLLALANMVGSVILGLTAALVGMIMARLF